MVGVVGCVVVAGAEGKGVMWISRFFFSPSHSGVCLLSVTCLCVRACVSVCAWVSWGFTVRNRTGFEARCEGMGGLLDGSNTDGRRRWIPFYCFVSCPWDEAGKKTGRLIRFVEASRVREYLDSLL